MQGKIMKGIGGFYYVFVEEHGLYECKAKGAFRNQKRKPMVGDCVLIEVLDEAEHLGNMIEILERKNALIRPAVANVDQAMMIFAMADPVPNLNLLDRFLLLMNHQQVNTIICFNKMDLSTMQERERLREIYENCGCEVLFVSVSEAAGLDRVREVIQGKTTVLAGPSGVGKSSLLNAMHPEIQMQTGGISEKIRRGKHTTRHSELILLQDGTYLVDTPGFTSLYVDGLKKEELTTYFYEVGQYEPDCRFAGCSHIYERECDCGVKQALAEGKIHPARYDSYVMLYQELAQSKQHRY